MTEESTTKWQEKFMETGLLTEEGLIANWWDSVMPAVFTWLKELKSGTLDIDVGRTQELASDILSAEGSGGTRMGGLVGSGTLGENSHLNPKQRLFLLKALKEVATKHNVPLISGASAETKEEIGEIVRGLISDAGVDVVMVMPPKTKEAPTNDEMYEYYKHAAEVAGAQGKQIMPYNNPDAAGYHAISFDVLQKLSVDPRVAALKISTVDVFIIQKLMMQKEDLKVLAGVDTVTVPAGLSGASGGITGVGDIFPKASVEMQELVLRKEFAEAEKIARALSEVSELDAQPDLLELLKCAMGIHHNDKEGGLRTWGRQLSEKEVDDVEARYRRTAERVDALGLL